MSMYINGILTIRVLFLLVKYLTFRVLFLLVIIAPRICRRTTAANFQLVFGISLCQRVEKTVGVYSIILKL